MFDASTDQVREIKTEASLVDNIKGHVFDSLISKMWTRISVDDTLKQTDKRLHTHFKAKGSAPLPGNDFTELGFDLEDFDLGIDDTSILEERPSLL